MYPSRERVEADLKGVVKGEVLCDDLSLQMYASDASIYEIRPLCVVRPKNTGDVVSVVRYATEHEIPIHPRGAGTGLAGESLGPGLVIDFSHSMRRVLQDDGERLRVQPGAVLGFLDSVLASQGRCFGPDPANRAVGTIGGALSVDGTGSHWPIYGTPRDHIESMKVVVATGDVVEFKCETLSQITTREITDRSERIRSSLAISLAHLVESKRKLIDNNIPKSKVNRSGYRLDDLVADDKIHLEKLLIGSEGTLGVITEATIRTNRLPYHRGVIIFLFDRLENAATAAIEVQKHGVSACDLMDRRLLSLACESDVRYDVLLPNETEALLLVEKIGDSVSEVRESLNHLRNIIRRRKKLAFDARIAIEPDDVNFFWQLPLRVVPTLYRLKGTTRPLPFIEDIAVPPNDLGAFLVRLQNVLKKHQITASLFAHAGHGQLHVRPFLDLADSDHLRRIEHLARDLYSEVLDVGGTISGEHGDGLSRTWFLREQFGPLYDVFCKVKDIFDPNHIFNPGKIIDREAQAINEHLRPVAATDNRELAADSSEPDAVIDVGDGENPATLFQVELNWKEEDITFAARSCNGCGGCRTTSSAERMCPMFRIQPSEESTPRAKANLMRAILTGRLDATLLSSDALKEVADLCVNCHQCRLECPASVDIPKLMIEGKAQYVSHNGLRTSDWLLTRLDKVASWFMMAAPIVNLGLRNPHVRWVLEKALGIAQGRKLPQFTSRSFLRRAARRRLTRADRRSDRKVLYFVDTYANWFDPQLAEAVISVLEHNGVTVFVHPRQRQSGMVLISQGVVEKAKRVARQNLILLADAVRQGFHIVGSEPSAVLCLTREYPNLIDDEDAQLVANNSSEICTYLWNLHQQGQLELDLKPLNYDVGYHQPCHMKALEVGSPGENLLRLIPGMGVRTIDQGCSGMAGTFGLKRENYRKSLRMGWGLISSLRNPELQFGTTECSTCKIQMEQGTNKPTIHPIKMLAYAYGVMPEIGSIFTKTSEDLVVT